MTRAGHLIDTSSPLTATPTCGRTIVVLIGILPL
jgi:hypothetical protein